MKLTKIIPERKKTIIFKWCKKDFTTIDKRFRRLQPKLTSCFWCNHEFENGETIALACPEKGKNKILCQKCAEELLNI